jgi:hypothetical protein
VAISREGSITWPATRWIGEATRYCGTYSITGNSIELNPSPGKKTFSISLKKNTNGGILLDAYTFQPPSKDLRLAGFYRYNFGGGRVGMGQHGITFYKDGRFTDSASTVVITPVPQARGGTAQAIGTYSIDGYTLELHYSDGTLRRRSFWENTKNSAYIDGVLYTIPTPH